MLGLAKQLLDPERLAEMVQATRHTHTQNAYGSGKIEWRAAQGGASARGDAHSRTVNVGDCALF